MADSENPDPLPAKQAGGFPKTRWSLIAQTRSGDKATAHRALNELCAQYHYPLYCAIRGHGLAHHDAEDALHDFLVKLLRLEAFAGADATKGRLRALLGTALQRFLHNWQRDQPYRTREISLDEKLLGEHERRYEREPAPDLETPERIFDRQWARELMSRVIGRLESDYVVHGKGDLFQALSPVLQRGGSLRGEDAPALAAKLHRTEPALRKAHQRLLEDYRELLEREVLRTVDSREEMEAEIVYLQGLFGKL